MIKLTDNEPNEKTGPHAPNAPRSRIEDTITLRLPSRDTLPNPLIKELLDFLLEAGKIGIPREKFFSKIKRAIWR